MSSAVDSRLKNANLGSWHQLVSLNEGMINQQFKNMWALADNTSAIKTFQHTKPHTSPPETMTAVLGPPRIKLRIDGSNLSSVIYFIDMLQGSSMSTFKDADSNDMVTIDMTNWSIACKVDVGTISHHLGALTVLTNGSREQSCPGHRSCCTRLQK